MLLELDNRGKRNWISKVRMKLCNYGFGFVWINQGVGDVKGFVRVFRERLVDCWWQDWNDHVQTSSRFDFYRLWSHSRCLPVYMSERIDCHLKCIMTRFRLGISDISVHYYRYRQSCHRDLICPLCRESEEDEIHFVLSCPGLRDIREQYIPRKYYTFPCLFRLTSLMTSANDSVVRNLAIYLHQAFKRRSVCIS